MPRNKGRGKQIFEDTLTGADLVDSIGIYDETDNYSTGTVRLWKAIRYTAIVPITGGVEGDLSNAPDGSLRWLPTDGYISVNSDYTSSDPWVFRTMEIITASDINITMPASGFQSGEKFFFQTLSGNAILNPNGYTIDGNSNNIVLPSDSYLEIEKTTGNDWKIIRSKNISKEFSPSDLANLEFWMDANDSSSFTLSGNTITACTEKANSYATASVSGTPQLQSGQINGKAAIFFDGSNDNLNFGDRELHNNGAGRGLHIYAVAKPTATGDVVIGKYTVAGNMREWFFRTGYTRIYENGDQSGNEATTNIDMIIGDWSIGELSWEAGSRSKYYLNGGLRGQSSNAVNDIEDTGADLIVGTYNGLSNDMNGWIAEICVFSRPLTTAEQAQMNEYFTNKYAIPASQTQTAVRSITMQFTSSGNLSTDRYLDVDGMASNINPITLPFASTLKSVSISTEKGTNETWTCRVRRNEVNRYNRSITAVDKTIVDNITTTFEANDEIMVYAELGTSGTIRNPKVTLVFEKR